MSRVEKAADLSAGLDHRVARGRIYAGQTGATKWPSGTIGKATLASRIGSNHLRGRIRGSTFRLTLAACLTTPLQLNRIDSQHLDTESEQRLSAWMRKHLEVAVLRFPYRDSLGNLEQLALDAYCAKGLVSRSWPGARSRSDGSTSV